MKTQRSRKRKRKRVLYHLKIIEAEKKMDDKKYNFICMDKQKFCVGSLVFKF